MSCFSTNRPMISTSRRWKSWKRACSNTAVRWCWSRTTVSCWTAFQPRCWGWMDLGARSDLPITRSGRPGSARNCPVARRNLRMTAVALAEKAANPRLLRQGKSRLIGKCANWLRWKGESAKRNKNSMPSARRSKIPQSQAIGSVCRKLARNWRRRRKRSTICMCAGPNSRKIELRRRVSLAAGVCTESLFAKQALPADPGIGASLFVGVVRIRGFAGAHEAVACAVVGHRVVGFARRFHLGDGIRKRGVDARVVACIEAVNGSLDTRHRVLLRRHNVENKGCGQIRPIRGEAERLASTPAEAPNKKFAVRSRELQRVIRCGIQVRSHLVGIKVADGLHRFAFREVGAAAAVRAHAGEKVGSDCNVAGRGDLICQILHPVRHPKDFVNDQHDGNLALRL